MGDSLERSISLAIKLLRLAAPSSGTTEAERSNAALKAAQIIDEYKLTLVVTPSLLKKRKLKPSTKSTWIKWIQYVPPVSSNWTEAWVETPCSCISCGRSLYEGEHAWFDTQYGFIHYDITCAEPNE